MEEKSIKNKTTEEAAESKNPEKSAQKKKKSPARIVLTVLLSLIAAAVAAVLGFALYVIIGMSNAGPTVDDIDALLAAPPVSASDRFAVTSSGDIAMKIYKDDVWWYIRKEYGEDFESEIDAALAEYGIEYKGVGINISEEEGASIDFSAEYKNIDVAVNAPLAISCKDGTLTVSLLDGVKVAGIKLPASLLEKVSGYDLGSIFMEFTPETFFIEEIDNVTSADGCVLFSGRLSEAPFEGLKTISSRKIVRSIFFMDEFDEVMPAIYMKDNGDEAWRQFVADQVRTDASAFTRYAFEILSLMDAKYLAKSNIKTANNGFIERWLYDFDKVADNSLNSEKKYIELSVKCDETIALLALKYRRNELKMGENGFEYDGKPFSFEDFRNKNEDKCISTFNDDNSSLVIIAKPGVSDKYNLTAAEVFPESYITAAGIDGTQKYPVGILYTDPDTGWRFLAYRSISNIAPQGVVTETIDYNVRPLLEDEAASLQDCQVTPAVIK